MIKEVHITKMGEIYGLLNMNEYLDSAKRYRSRFLFRGLSNSTYSLQTSLQRNCKELSAELEIPILRNFSKYAANESPDINESVWRQLVIGQHHGLPTRLLDWTYSALIALHFAVSSTSLDSLDKNDCAIWAIDIIELNSLLPYEYKEVLKKENAYLYTIDMLEKSNKDLEVFDKDMESAGKAVLLLEPPSIDQRIISQYSYFSVFPNCVDNFEEFLNVKTNNTVKYIIDKSLKWQIRDLLDGLNINERIVYPGLDGISTWLKRHYFVK